MKRVLWAGMLCLAACGADGPPITPTADETDSPAPDTMIETTADSPAVDGDLSRPLDAAGTTEEF